MAAENNRPHPESSLTPPPGTPPTAMLVGGIDELYRRLAADAAALPPAERDRLADFLFTQTLNEQLAKLEAELPDLTIELPDLNIEWPELDAETPPPSPSPSLRIFTGSDNGEA